MGDSRRVALTESQYMELVRYEHGHPMARSGRPNSNLIRRNLLMHADGRGTGFYIITPHGRTQLAAFRVKHGLPEGS